MSGSCKGGLCLVPGGCFYMGSQQQVCGDITIDGFLKESYHEVALRFGFYMMQSEVTQAAFEGLMGYNNSRNRIGDVSDQIKKGEAGSHPVEFVNWYEAAAYANKLSLKEGLDPCYTCDGGARGFVRCTVAQAYASDPYLCPGYRLPTDAEWEHAFRAGSSDDFYAYDGTKARSLTKQETCLDADNKMKSCCNIVAKWPHLDQIAWYGANSSKTTNAEDAQHHKVMDTKYPNKLGLHDMTGNVWEWTQDWAKNDLGNDGQSNPWGPASGTVKVLRGGSYEWNMPKYFRASVRRATASDKTMGVGDTPDHVCHSVGFRLVRTLLDEKSHLGPDSGME